MAKPEIAEEIDGQLAVDATPPHHQLAGVRGACEAASDRRAPLSLVRSRNDFEPVQALRPRREPEGVPAADERRRWERDLHDGVQTELVALIIKLAVTRQDAQTPPALVEMLAGLEARAQAALDAVRDIARGIYPPTLADFGLAEALRAQAARAAIDVRVEGTAPRGAEANEEAVYFACLEAIQNAAKYAGRGAHVALRLRFDAGSLAVRIADNGRGFDPAQTPEGAGVRNTRDRIQDLRGTLEIASNPGHGTVLTISVPWPVAANGWR